MKITKELLESKGAEPQVVARFAAWFPDGLEAIEATCAPVAHEFDWDWFAFYLLPALLRREYEVERENLHDVFEKDHKFLLRIYDDRYGRLWNYGEFPRSTPDPEMRERRRTIRVALYFDFGVLQAEYDSQRAALFGRLAGGVW
jgi:hypothetical protein